MADSAPGKHHREGITLFELAERFPTEQVATEWFESIIWPTGRTCGHCGSDDTHTVRNRKPMPYRCRSCRSYFSVRTGTVLASTRLPLRKWAFAVYLVLTNLKSVSSMKLHRDLGITQKTAWHMLHRIREAWTTDQASRFVGPVEADESFFGGRAKNMHASKRRELTGRGGVDKTAVVGVKDRATNQVAAQVVDRTDAKTLQGFVTDHTAAGAFVFTDDNRAYAGLQRHATVRHSAHEYVVRPVHTNGVESFWSMLKRAHKGTFHVLSEKHLQRYVTEFAARHNIREMDTADQMATTVRGMVGRSLPYAVLTGDPAPTFGGDPW